MLRQFHLKNYVIWGIVNVKRHLQIDALLTRIMLSNSLEIFRRLAVFAPGNLKHFKNPNPVSYFLENKLSINNLTFDRGQINLDVYTY